MTDVNRWVSVWGNAVSVAENRPERYAKNITIRYPVRVPFDGSALRLTFDNYCGTEAITMAEAELPACNIYDSRLYKTLHSQFLEIAVCPHIMVSLEEIHLHSSVHQVL